MSRRVVVTGMGCISPVGHGPQQAWEGACRGDSGAVVISRFDASSFPTRIAAEVRNFDLASWIARDEMPSFDKAGPNIRYGMAAAVQAMRDSGLQEHPSLDPSRFGVYLGAGEGPQDFPLLMQIFCDSIKELGTHDVSHFTGLALRRMDPEFERNQEPNLLAARIAGQYGAEGPNLNCLTACAASAQAIGEGSELIRTGAADVMIVGGSHSMIHPFGLTGFCLLTALSTRNDAPGRASRPFDRERDGFVLGEGAGMLVLEEYEHARARGAHIHGEILGYGVTSDAYRITDVPPDGNGIARAMLQALRDAALDPRDISYVNAHGTSTPSNDRTETQALKTVFGDHVRQLPISSTKGSTGHLVAACGAVEAIFSLLALKHQTIPPTANYEYPDPDCDLDYVPVTPRSAPLTTVMSNNCGFGGQNVTLIFARV